MADSLSQPAFVGRRGPVVDHELEALQAVPVIHFRPEQRVDARRHRHGGAERDRREALAAAREVSFAWPSPTARCATTSNVSSNAGGGKPWPQTQSHIAVPSSSVSSPGANAPSLSWMRCNCASDSVSRATASNAAMNRAAASGANRQAGGECVTSEAEDRARRALRHEIERIAQVESGDRAPRSLELMLAAARKHDDRPVIAVLQPRRDDADHALVPLRPMHAQRERVRRRRAPRRSPLRQALRPASSPRCRGDRDSADRARAPSARPRARIRRAGTGCRATCPTAAPRRSGAGPATNPRSLALARADVAAGDGEQRGDARMRAAVANPREALLDEDRG